MAKVNYFKVDPEKQCIDRSSKGGQMFDELQRDANSNPNPGKAQFMNQVLAFTEAATVVANTLPENESEKAIGKLRGQMESMVNK